MTRPVTRLALPLLLLALAGCASSGRTAAPEAPPGPTVQYLEIVTPEVDATCATYTELHGVTFGDPVAGLGGARTAPLAGGGRIGVRAPMRPDEDPTVRAYLLVDDVEAAASAAVDEGGELALPPMEVAGEGHFAIFLQGGVFHALWQL